MNSHADKTTENKSQSVANSVTQKQSGSESTFHFVDNRPEAVAQRKLPEIADNSPRALKLRVIQGMANNSPQAKKEAQLQAMADKHSAQQQQPIQKIENNTGLPDSLKSGIENLSGYSMDDVKVHRNSEKPAQLQAHAYAQGTDIHLGPGQEKHLPHEAWHVVQQKQGRVQPTVQMHKGININDDVSLESEAEVMGEKALSTGSNTKTSTSENSILKNVSAPVQRVIQRVRIVPKAVNGLTHPVRLTRDGHLFNEQYRDNELLVVKFGDLLRVDMDNQLYSRRGIHQEDARKRHTDGIGDRNKLWVQLISVNGIGVGPRVYVRADMLKEPIKVIQPRDHSGVFGAVESAKGVFARTTGDKGSHQIIDEIRASLFGIRGRMHSDSADSQVNLNTIGDSIGVGRAKVQELFEAERISDEERIELDGEFQKLIAQFDEYNSPKQVRAIDGLISAEYMHQMGYIGLDIGGIGIENDYLDVNVDDSTANNKNALVIGDAMNLQASFEPDCTDNVIARLLPLVLMVGQDSVAARIRAIGATLNSVNYVTGGGGTASIQFNDNSGEFAVTEEPLLLLADQLGFTLNKDSPVPGRWRSFTFTRG